jgi:hypothetical protein
MRKLLLALLAFLPLVSQGAAPKLPPRAECERLARESLLQFNDAVKAKDFTGFHKTISQLWQGQITPAELLDAFRSFVDQDIDISPIRNAEPVFEPAPKIDSDGVLTLEGNYPLRPNKVIFRLKYVNESGAWKLLGAKINVLPSGPTDVKLPGDKEIKALVRQSLLAFNDAVQAGNFREFYQRVAEMWQQQTTPEKLQKNFQSFIDQEVNIAPIATLEPTFTKPPAIDEDGLLQLQGSYATKPSAIRFTLAYLFEAPEWRLVKINVKVGNPEEASP